MKQLWYGRCMQRPNFPLHLTIKCCKIAVESYKYEIQPDTPSPSSSVITDRGSMCYMEDNFRVCNTANLFFCILIANLLP